MNKVIEEKAEGEERISQQDNNNMKNQQEQKQKQLSLAAQAYKLFSEGKTLLQVAIALNLGESEVTKFYREY